MNKLSTKLILALGILLLSLPVFAEPVWIDVRTAEEYLEDNIQGDMNIPLAVLSPESLTEIIGRDQEIYLYCRSGNRAGQAQTLLEEAGFTNVHNAGGIEDARQMRAISKDDSNRTVEVGGY